MISEIPFKVLLPERILKEKENWTEQNFIFIVSNYLKRYPYYKLIRVEGPFAICDRVGEINPTRKKRNQKKPDATNIGPR